MHEAKVHSTSLHCHTLKPTGLSMRFRIVRRLMYPEELLEAVQEKKNRREEVSNVVYQSVVECALSRMNGLIFYHKTGILEERFE